MDEKNYWVLKGRIGWYQGEQGEQSFVDETIVGRFDNTVYPTDWALFSTGFICPPPAADSGRWEFTFSFFDGSGVKAVVIDDVYIITHTQPGSCPFIESQ